MVKILLEWLHNCQLLKFCLPDIKRSVELIFFIADEKNEKEKEKLHKM